MKNLKKLATMGAIFAASHFANAQEKEFSPMGVGQEIDSIELVNGQIMVRPADASVPYYFVGTNTTDFASSGFAHKDMTNFTSEVHSDDAVYATREGDKNKLFTYPLRKNRALNGVPTEVQTNTLAGIYKVISVDEENVLGLDKQGNLINYTKDGQTVATNSLSYKNGDDLYEAKSEDTLDIVIYKNGNTKVGYWNQTGSQPKSLVAFGEEQIYLLTKDGKVYTNNTSDKNSKGLSDKPIMSDVKSLIPTKDGKGYIVAKNDGSVISYTLDSEGKTTANTLAEAKKVASKEFKANGIRYYANGKKLGYEM